MSTTAGSSTRGGGGVFVKAVALALAVGLFAFIGVRVKDTLADRKAMSTSLAEQTKTGAARAGAQTVHAVEKRWRPTIPVTGTLSPREEADVGFKTGGRLVAVRAKVGDRVRVGQPLGALDVAEAAAQAAATAAGVRAAQVSYDMAKDGEKRTRALFEQHAVSDAESLGAENRAALALAQLEQARAQAQLAAVSLGNGSLGAPFAGLVTRAPDGIGKIVAPGEPLFHLSNTTILKLMATLSEADARLVELGADVRIDDDAEGKQEPPHGKVTAVLGSLDAQTRRVPFYAEIGNDHAPPLLAGSFVRATVTSGKEITVLELPPGALRPGSQDEVVVLENGKAHIVRVVFTQAEGGAVRVLHGITAASAVVLNPSSEVREGDDLGPAGK
jgi:RND family efflux transporter MFP subunit